MPPDRLIARIEQRAPCEFITAFVASAMASRRKPAARRCSSQREARRALGGGRGRCIRSARWVGWSAASPREFGPVAVRGRV